LWGCAAHAIDPEEAKRLWDFRYRTATLSYSLSDYLTTLFHESIAAIEGKQTPAELVAAEKAKEDEKKQQQQQ